MSDSTLKKVARSRTRITKKQGLRYLLLYTALLALVLGYYWLNDKTTEYFAPQQVQDATDSQPAATPSTRFELKPATQINPADLNQATSPDQTAPSQSETDNENIQN